MRGYCPDCETTVFACEGGEWLTATTGLVECDPSIPHCGCGTTLEENK